ncbi:MAG TPA: DUF3108 domain-containing protein [Bryobacteraceae bacterium]|nr:DUF3108 domain-containing protein [Bryobacteraceae bacterium]
MAGANPANRAARVGAWLLAAVFSAVAQAPAPQSAPAQRAHETFDYSVEWRLITAGRAHLEWNGTAADAGDVKLQIRSTGIVSRLYPVDDEYSATLSPGFCAQGSFISAQEGSRHKETRVTYDAQAHKASFLEKDLTKNTTTAQEVTIPSCVHDLIGGLIALRYMRVEPGKTAQIPVSDGKKFVMAKVEARRREVLKSSLGPVNAILYEIYLFDNVLFRRSGHLYVWITDDDRRLPIQLQVRLQFAIGTITFKMEKPTGAEPVSGGK